MSVGKELVDIIKKSESRETKAYDTTATVTRVEGSTIWVHIPGGVDETPVQKTINANPGDSVQVRVSGGSAWLVGNATAPPTDDGQAIIAQKIARTATKVAESAQMIAGNTNQYFWHTESGNDTGAHITEIPKADFLADPSNGGGNLLARSNGIAVRNGLDELAQFGANGVINGNASQMHTTTDYHSFSMINKDGGTVFVVESQITSDGYAYFEDVFTTDSTTKRYVLSNLPAITSTAWDGALIQVEILEVKLDGTILQDETDYTFSNHEIAQAVKLTNFPASNQTLTVKYRSDSKYLCDFTFGERKSGEPVGYASYSEGLENSATGTISHAEGWSTEASDIASHAEGKDTHSTNSYSHAEGFGTYATGLASHAEGNVTEASGTASHASGVYTIASRKSQTVIGEYNVKEDGNHTTRGNYVFIIGNGVAGARSNALTVDWSGNIAIAGTLTQGSDRRLKDHISYLDEDAIEFVRQLKPAHYIKDGADHVGFYAQDVESVDTWNCMIGEMNGYKTLGYTELIAPLVAYCQHLEKRIEELEDKK